MVRQLKNFLRPESFLSGLRRISIPPQVKLAYILNGEMPNNRENPRIREQRRMIEGKITGGRGDGYPTLPDMRRETETGDENRERLRTLLQADHTVNRLVAHEDEIYFPEGRGQEWAYEGNRDFIASAIRDKKRVFLLADNSQSPLEEHKNNERFKQERLRQKIMAEEVFGERSPQPENLSVTSDEVFWLMDNDYCMCRQSDRQIVLVSPEQNAEEIQGQDLQDYRASSDNHIAMIGEAPVAHEQRSRIAHQQEPRGLRGKRMIEYQSCLQTHPYIVQQHEDVGAYRSYNFEGIQFTENPQNIENANLHHVAMRTMQDLTERPALHDENQTNNRGPD